MKILTPLIFCLCFSFFFPFIGYSNKSGAGAGAGVPLSEYKALVKFYQDTNGKNWKTNTNWLDTINCSVASWYGIETYNGHVEGLYLSNNNLSGVLSKAIVDLPNLIALDLGSNSLTGTIVPEIGSLPKLEYVKFESNFIGGKIPSETGNLSNLRFLDLHNNHIEGPLPVNLVNLTKLNYLNVENNWIGKTTDYYPYRVADQIPDTLQFLPSLTQFFIDYNYLLFNDIEPIFSWNNFNKLQLFQYIPQVETHLDKTITVDRNDDVTITMDNYYPGKSDQYQWMKDGVPVSDANNSELIIKNVQPDDAGQYYCVITNSKVPNLEITNYSTILKVNAAKGAGVPLSEFSALEKFYQNTHGNNWKNHTNWLDTINHSVSEWIGVDVYNKSVRYLSLDSNRVSGVLPTELADLKQLEGLFLLKNNLQGNIPETLTSLSKLKYISMDENQLEGAIPENIGNLASLSYLGLSKNKLSGNIPPSVGQCINLDYITLSNNNLSGTIPSTIGNLTKLRYFLLNNNQLIGPVPPELGNLTNIIKFTIDNNLIGAAETPQSKLRTKSAYFSSARQIPDNLAGLISVDTLHIGNNALMFNDIEPIFFWSNFEDINEFIYSPQDPIGLEQEKQVTEGDHVVLSMINYMSGNSDHYQWYKNNSIIPNATLDTLGLLNVQLSDSGTYYCVVTNAVATKLTLQSKDIFLKVEKAQTDGIGNSYSKVVTVYPNPATDQIFIDTKGQAVDLQVFTIAGALIFEIEHFESQWIDVHQFGSGTFTFKIKFRESNGMIYKKVVIR